MTRAMDTLILSRARYRRRYGTDMPEASVPSRFLEEVPQELMQDLGSPRERSQKYPSSDYGGSRHYAYEDEDQRPQYGRQKTPQRSNYEGPSYNSIDNIAEFFASRGKKFTRPKVEVPASDGPHRIQARSTGAASEIRRGNGLQARGRWGRREDYGTISKIRFEKAGRKVRPTGKGVNSVYSRNAEFMANTKTIADKAERKKVKRTARKKATPKAKRTYARGAEKRKVKKMVRGTSKR